MNPCSPGYALGVRRRIAILFVVALSLIGIALWARFRDQAALPGGWRPPKLAVGRARQAPISPGDPEVALEWGVITCTIDAALGDDPGRLVARSTEDQTAVSTAEGRALTLNVTPGEWTVNWHSGGDSRNSELRRLGMVEVDAGEVQRCTLPKAGWTLSGNVVDLHGEPQSGAWVEGCRTETRTDEHGLFTLVLQRGDCLVRAWSADGALQRPGEPVYFSPFDPPASPTFRLDTAQIGGVGLALVGATEGLRVSYVLPGGPGEIAGIEAGDVIVEADGESTAGWSVSHGVENITGTPGTQVRLRVQRGDVESEYALVRARIEEPAAVESEEITP